MKILLVVAIAVFAIGTIFVIGQAAGMFKSNPKVTDEKGKAQVTVPDILGMTVEEATETLNKKGLGLSIAERAYSDKYEKGEIMEQKTAANKKVDKNTEIQVVVSNSDRGSSGCQRTVRICGAEDTGRCESGRGFGIQV